MIKDKKGYFRAFANTKSENKSGKNVWLRVYKYQ
jgi:hypothetical protein